MVEASDNLATLFKSFTQLLATNGAALVMVGGEIRLSKTAIVAKCFILYLSLEQTPTRNGDKYQSLADFGNWLDTDLSCLRRLYFIVDDFPVLPMNQSF